MPSSNSVLSRAWITACATDARPHNTFKDQHKIHYCSKKIFSEFDPKGDLSVLKSKKDNLFVPNPVFSTCVNVNLFINSIQDEKLYAKVVSNT